MEYILFTPVELAPRHLFNVAVAATYFPIIQQWKISKVHQEEEV
jgi:hypothetical protein